MLTIHGRASKGKSDNAKLMYWFPLIGAQTLDNATRARSDVGAHQLPSASAM